MRRRNEDERRGVSPPCEPAGIRALGSKVLIVRMALGERLYASKSAAMLGIGMHLRVIHKLNPKKRQVEEREP